MEDYEGARQLGEEAVRYAEQSGDDHVLAHALATWAVIQEGFDAIAAAARPALAALHRIGQMDQIARLCSISGFVGISEGREREALPLLEEGVRAARASAGDRLKYVLGNLALAQLFLGDLAAAEDALVETVAATVWSVDEPLIDEPLLALAVLHGQRGNLEKAATLEGVANAHPSPSRHSDEMIVWDRLNALLAPSRERLDAAAWERAARRGAAMTPRDALELVQQRDAAPVPPS